MKVYMKSILFVLIVILLSAPLSGVLSSAKQSTPTPPSPHPEVRFRITWTPEEFQNVLKGNYDKYAAFPELYKLYSLMNQQGCLVPENLSDDFERIANTHQQGVYPVIYVTSDHYTGKLVEIRTYYYDKDEALANGAPENVFSDQETFCHYLESFYRWNYCPISIHPDDDPLENAVTDCQMVEFPNGKNAHLCTKKEYTAFASEFLFYKNLSFFEGEKMITFQFPSETTTEEILMEVQSLRLLDGNRFNDETDNPWFFTDFGLPEEYQREAWETRKTLYEKTCLPKAPVFLQGAEATMDWSAYEQPDHEKRVAQIKAEEPLILIVKPTSNTVQYTYPGDMLHTSSGITLTKATVVAVLRNKNAEQIAEGQTIWIKESYNWYADENGTDLFYSMYGANCKPLFENHEYLIAAERFEEATKETVYSFDEQYFWDTSDIDGSKMGMNYYLYKSRLLYASFWEIDAYKNDVFEHFGIIEKNNLPLILSIAIPSVLALSLAIAVIVVSKRKKNQHRPSIQE